MLNPWRMSYALAGLLLVMAAAPSLVLGNNVPIANQKYKNFEVIGTEQDPKVTNLGIDLPDSDKTVALFDADKVMTGIPPLTIQKPAFVRKN